MLLKSSKKIILSNQEQLAEANAKLLLIVLIFIPIALFILLLVYLLFNPEYLLGILFVAFSEGAPL